MLYVVDATLGFGWSVYRTLGGFYSPTFPWWGIPLLLGSLVLAGRAALAWNSEANWTRWLSVIGTGLLAAYFVPAAAVTLRGYAQGKIIASTVQLGTSLAIVAFVVVCFAVALWDIWDSDRLKPEE